MSKYPHFTQALRELAPTNKERAALLGVSVRSVIYYLRGEYLPHQTTLKRHPQLDEALARDVQLVPFPGSDAALIAA